jgi:hypothetical protein
VCVCVARMCERAYVRVCISTLVRVHARVLYLVASL